MKKIFVLVLAFASGVTVSQAKGKNPNSTVWSHLRACRTPVAKPSQQGKTIYVITSFDVLAYNTVTKAYDSSMQHFYTYNSKDSVILDRIKDWSSSMGKFTNAEDITYTYDAAGYRRLKLGQVYYGTDIKNFSKDSSVYDAHGNYTYLEKKIWDIGDWKTEEITKRTYTYDNNGFLTSIAQQYADTSGNFQNDYKILVIRDNTGKILSEANYLSNGSGGWNLTDSIKGTFYNNQYDKPVSAILKTKDVTGSFNVAGRATAVYDANGNETSFYTETYDNFDNVWVPQERQTWKFHKNVQALYTDEVYDNSSWTLNSGQADSLTFDSNGNVSLDDQTVYQPSNSTWAKMYKIYYHYKTATGVSETTVTDNGVRMYPNPVTDNLHIAYTTTPAGSIFVSLYDMAGRLVYETQSTGAQNISLPLGNLNNGVYSLRIVNGQDISSRLIVKQ